MSDQARGMRGMFDSMFSRGQNRGADNNRNQSGNGNQGDTNADDDQNNQDGGLDNVEEDQFAPLRDIFAEEEEDDSGGDDQNQNQNQNQNPPNNQNQNQNPPNQQTAEQKLVGEIQMMLKGIKITQEDLGQDFDVNDPAKFATAMSNIQQKAAMATLQITLKPVQAALTQMMGDFRTMLDEKFKDFSQGNNRKAALEALVPEVNDPNFSGLVKTVFDQALKKAKNANEAAQATRKALDAMGISSKKNQNSDPSEAGSSRREGADALNLYAPMPQQNRRQGGNR